MAQATSSSFERFERVSNALATGLVIFGGFCLILACALTAASIFGAILIRPLPGEIELVEVLCGLGVFAFLPFCQLKRGHVGVDILISALGQKAMNRTQLIGDIIIGVLTAVITWRHAIGTMDKLENGETTQLLLLPVWWGYAIALLILMASLVVCLYVILADIRDIRQGKTIVAAMGAH